MSAGYVSRAHVRQYRKLISIFVQMVLNNFIFGNSFIPIVAKKKRKEKKYIYNSKIGF